MTDEITQALVDALRDAPILSMHHTIKGFDYDGFVNAYYSWAEIKREALAKYESSQPAEGK